MSFNRFYFRLALGLCQYRVTEFMSASWLAWSKHLFAWTSDTKLTKAMLVVKASLLTRLKLTILPNLANFLRTISLVNFLSKLVTYRLVSSGVSGLSTAVGQDILTLSLLPFIGTPSMIKALCASFSVLKVISAFDWLKQTLEMVSGPINSFKSLSVNDLG